MPPLRFLVAATNKLIGAASLVSQPGGSAACEDRSQFCPAWTHRSLNGVVTIPLRGFSFPPSIAHHDQVNGELRMPGLHPCQVIWTEGPEGFPQPVGDAITAWFQPETDQDDRVAGE